MSKFVLFANARSGSTSLAKLLDESPDVKLCMEPFHPKYSTWNPQGRDYSKFIKDPKTMNQSLDEIFSKYTAMKVLEYQISEEIYLTMLGRRDLKIILLQRKNLSKAALSSLIGQQTSIWQRDEMDESKYKDLKSIDLQEIKKIVDYIGELNEMYADFLERNRKGEYIHLYYEDLFSEDMVKNKKTVSEICKFLDILPPNEGVIEKYMKPSNSKQNQDDLYKKVPNRKEIEKHFPGIFD